MSAALVDRLLLVNAHRSDMCAHKYCIIRRNYPRACPRQIGTAVEVGVVGAKLASEAAAAQFNQRYAKACQAILQAMSNEDTR